MDQLFDDLRLAVSEQEYIIKEILIKEGITGREELGEKDWLAGNDTDIRKRLKVFRKQIGASIDHTTDEEEEATPLAYQSSWEKKRGKAEQKATQKRKSLPSYSLSSIPLSLPKVKYR
jgi:hypothetical protein